MVKSMSQRQSSDALRKTSPKSATISRSGADENNVHELMSRLKSILPGVGSSGNDLDIVQNAIYYIQDLNDMLMQSSNDEPRSPTPEAEPSNPLTATILSVPESLSSGNSTPFTPPCTAGRLSTPVF